MNDQIAFTVHSSGEPVLAGEGEEPPLPADLQDQVPTVPAPGWTPEEAAQMVASIFTTGVLVAYVARWSAMPEPELWPYLAAAPNEFPQLGTGLAPLLDRFLPKGTAGGIAAAGVGILAGVGELGVAAARRVRVVAQVGPAARESAAGQASEPAATAPAEASVYRLPRELVRVAEERSALTGLGLAA